MTRLSMRTIGSSATTVASRHGYDRCGLERDRTAAVVMRGHALMQNIRRGHYELGVDARPHVESPTRSWNSRERSDRRPNTDLGLPRSSRINPTVPSGSLPDLDTSWGTPYGDRRIAERHVSADTLGSHGRFRAGRESEVVAAPTGTQCVAKTPRVPRRGRRVACGVARRSMWKQHEFGAHQRHDNVVSRVLDDHHGVVTRAFDDHHGVASASRLSRGRTERTHRPAERRRLCVAGVGGMRPAARCRAGLG